MNLDPKVWRAADFEINLSISGIYYIAVIIIKYNLRAITTIKDIIS